MRSPRTPNKKLILHNGLSPGDIVMLTAAIRDLHLSNPGKFLTDVRTPCPALWEHNPFITPLLESDEDVVHVQCEYPLIHRSNSAPFHFIHGFIQFLSEFLHVKISPTDFKGDIYISAQEKLWASQIAEILKKEVPFWIIASGGKYDYTIKWWSDQRYQTVVDHFQTKICFVQVGELGHHHHPLRGVIDLRGKTDLRQLVRLMYHSQGVICPVTSLMHLAAAVEVPPNRSKNRPCVVIGGGRESFHWEAYPHHQYLHTIGALACCDTGGCWKSRTVPLNDGDYKDSPEQLCVDVINDLPHCMDLITAQDVISRIEMYFKGGAADYLTPSESRLASKYLSQGNKE